jgi:hypothetical protein
VPRFVTGAVDRVNRPAASLELVRRARAPILVIYGERTPPKSRAEMEALTQVPGVGVERLLRGKLAVREESPDLASAQSLHSW